MKMTRLLNIALVLGVVGVAASCGTDNTPTGVGPIPTQPDLLLGELLQPTGLLSCRPLPFAQSSATIGPEGGVIAVGPHKLVVPPFALSQRVTITATAPVGTVNLVEFEPHGLRFNRSAMLTMSYSNCSLLGVLLPKRIAYTNDLLQILEYLLSLDDLLGKKVTGRVNHFSGYAIAW